MPSGRGLKTAGDAFFGIFKPKSTRVVTHLAEEGGATARTARQAAAHDLAPSRPPQGAGLVPYTPKNRPPTVIRRIDPDQVIIDVTTPPKRPRVDSQIIDVTPKARRPPVDLNPAVSPLAKGLKWGMMGAGGGLAALGLAKLTRDAGEAWYHANEEQAPYVQTLPDGKSVFVMDPVTGETYILVQKGDGWDTQDPGGSEGGGNGYGVVPVSDGDRAEAEVKRSVADFLSNPWVIVALVLLLGVLVWYFAIRKKKGSAGAARASVKVAKA